MDAYTKNIRTLKRPNSEMAFGEWSLKHPDESDYVESKLFFNQSDPTPTQKKLIAYVNQTILGDLTGRILSIFSGNESYYSPGKISEFVALSPVSDHLEESESFSIRFLHDFETDSKLPFDDGVFDAALFNFHIGKLTRPIEFFREVARVLKPEGVFLVTFIHPHYSKQFTRMWAMGDGQDHVVQSESFFEYSGDFTKSTTLAIHESDNGFRWFHGGLAPELDDTQFIRALWAHKGQPPREYLDNPPFPKTRRIEKKGKADLTFDVAGRPLCPYCHKPMGPMEPPVTVFEIDYNASLLHVCFENDCEYYKSSKSWMRAQGQPGYTYRFMFNPENGSVGPIPDNLAGGLASSRID